VPKFGFRWQPFDSQLTFRGDYSKSFIAPNLYSEYGPTDTRQVGAGVIQGVFGSSYGGLPFNGEDGNNPNLKPARSTSRTIGFVFTPTFAKHLKVNADFSDINLDGFQGGIGFNNILSSVNTLGAASPFFTNLAIGAFPGQSGATNPFATPGALLAYLTNSATGKGDPTKAANLYAVDQFRNLAVLHEKSWIVGIDYTIPTGTLGSFELATSGAIFDSFEFLALPGQAWIQYAGKATNAGVFGGTLPKYRFYSTVDWTYGDFHVTLGNTFTSAVDDTGPNGISAPLPVSSYITFDARAAYEIHPAALKSLRFALGVNNFTNRMPPLAPRTFTDNNADVSTYSPIGRLFYGTVAVGF
jgi:iron complex outermembrane receptor protein